MTVLDALSAAIVADTDHIASFSSDGREHGWQDLLAAAARVSARLERSEGRRWALNLEDTFAFAAALVGCWAAGKTPVLTAPQMLDGGNSKIAFDGVIEPESAATTARERVVWEQLAPVSTRIEQITSSAQFVLCTSGSTGTPKEIARNLRNVEAELSVFESLWGETVGSTRVYSTVSHRHVYGLLFSVLWPMLHRRPFATFRLKFPEQLAACAGAGNPALVSSPALLKRIGHLPDGSGRWRAIFSSGGVLPEGAAADVTRVLGVCPVEVLGSTETSGVAWRRQEPPDPTIFTNMPTVETRLVEDDFLEARSPFSGQTGWLRMGDRVRFTGAGRFELLGRGDHLAKVEDKRVSLAEIEHHLLESTWIEDVAAIALEDDARQCVGVVVQLTPSGAAELARCGRRSFNEALKAPLRGRIERVALPRRFRYVGVVPTDSQGKRQPALLEALFGARDDR